MSDGRNRSLGSIKDWLIASVGINLFLAGCAAAMLFQLSAPSGTPPFGPGPGPGPRGMPGEFERRPPPPGPAFLMEWWADQMPPQDTKAFRSIYEQGAAQLRASDDETRSAMSKLRDLLTEEKPDTAKLNALLDKIQEADVQMHGTMAVILRRVAAELSPEARRRIADFLDRMPNAGPHRPLPPR